LSAEAVQVIEQRQPGIGERTSLSEIKEVLRCAYKIGRPVFLYGKPGIGKSSLVRSIAQELRIDFIDLRLSQVLPEDLRGFPKINGIRERQKTIMEQELEEHLCMGWRYLGTLPSGRIIVESEDKAEEETRWIRSEFLPTSGRGILFLDELPNAEPSKQNAALQLVLDRRLGNYILPEGWFVVAAGNGAEDRAHVFELSSALNNRFINIDFPVPTFEEWFDWGVGKIHPGIFGFLKLKPSMMFKFDPRAKDRAWPSLRTWEIASDLFKASSNDPSVVRFAVGEGAGIEFEGFWNLRSKMPDPDKVFQDPERAKIPDDLSLQHLMAAVVAERAMQRKDPKTVDAACAIISKLPPELGMMSIKIIVSTKGLTELVFKSKHWKQSLAPRWGKYLLNTKVE
jgi:hypothetical protein